MPNIPNYTNVAKRYSRTFEVSSTNKFESPFFVLAASTTGTAGQVVAYDTPEDVVKIAVSGSKNYQIAGFLLQDVKDLDGGNLKGYRNLNNTVVNYGDSVGVFQGGGVAYTKVYQGSCTLGTRLTVSSDGRGFLEPFTALVTADVIGVVEAVTSSKAPSNEPQQFSSASGNDWIRVRIFNL